MKIRQTYRKKPSFGMILGSIAAVNALIIAVVLVVLWRRLAVYEAQNPIAALQYFVQQVQSDAPDMLTEEIDAGELNTRADIAAYLSKTYPPGEYRFARLPKEDGQGDTDDAQRYALYDGDIKRGTVLLYRNTGDGNSWTVRPELVYEETYTLWAPQFVTVECAGVPLPDSCRTGNIKAAAGFAELRETDSIPRLVEYRMEKLLLPPQLTAHTAQGEACTVSAGEDAHTLTVCAAVTGETAKAFEQQLETVSKLYAEYISQDAERQALTAHLAPHTKFYDAVCAYDGKWYNKHISHAFENFSVGNIQRLSEDTYTGEVSFDYVVRRTYDSHTYPTKYLLAFQKINGRYLLVNLLVR